MPKVVPEYREAARKRIIAAGWDVMCRKGYCATTMDEIAAEAGVTAIVQPGGSVRDEEAVTAANEHGMAMIFTGRRHFRH